MEERALLRLLSRQWLAEILQVFNGGKITQYEELTTKYAPQLNAQPALLANVSPAPFILLAVPRTHTRTHT